MSTCADLTRSLLPATASLINSSRLCSRLTFDPLDREGNGFQPTHGVKRSRIGHRFRFRCATSLSNSSSMSDIFIGPFRCRRRSSSGDADYRARRAATLWTPIHRRLLERQPAEGDVEVDSRGCMPPEELGCAVNSSASSIRRAATAWPNPPPEQSPGHRHLG